MAQLSINEEPHTRAKRLVERVLRNMLRAAEESPDGRVRRSRAKYCLVDVPAAEFDSILKSVGINTYVDPRAKQAKYYKVDEIRKAYENLNEVQSNPPSNTPNVSM